MSNQGVLVYVGFLLLLTPAMSFGTWYDEYTAETTVLLEKQENDAFKVHGTGVLMFNYENMDFPIVVTNYHLLKRPHVIVTVTADPDLVEMMNSRGARYITFETATWELRGTRLSHEFETGYPTNPKFVRHPDATIDLAAFAVELGRTWGGKDWELGISKTMRVSESSVKTKDEVKLGDEVYFIGFPLGYGADEPISPIIRSASVARTNPGGKEFTLDALSFGGNSGSPIFTKRLLEEESRAWITPRLIGMVFAHHYLKAKLYTEDIGGGCTAPKPKATWIEIENLGLVRCVWSDDILKVARLVGSPEEDQQEGNSSERSE